jgi:hypothetical protein
MAGDAAWLGVMNLDGRDWADLCPFDIKKVDIVC